MTFIGDLSGVEHAYRMADGASLLTYRAGDSISSSAAEANGLVSFGASDNRLYALADGAEGTPGVAGRILDRSESEATGTRPRRTREPA